MGENIIIENVKEHILKQTEEYKKEESQTRRLFEAMVIIRRVRF